ncbi:MAG: hypothetical protein UU37_C0003G0016 [Candidatus Gottesmanbacteria bacterium GW2011_GWA2_41_12]|uniref:Uncharacterized protein n=1 Tax=Candidatus Gottesmanbacteria bacterium GW2011_GWA2_41_12 TaxID=1618440 RepID=A0A0G0XL56_9BACT|nr:MAG: hypothetical protein UU37_C0003G0016 [Candidatus Gottesmanbacteria bacterium GW2011_GWA2_41_12]
MILVGELQVERLNKLLRRPHKVISLTSNCFMGNALEHADEDDRLNRGKGDKLWTATVDLEKLIRTRRRALERAKKVKKT